MQYEVSKKAKSADEAFDAITTLSQPICVVVFKSMYDIVKEYAYQDVVDKVRKKIPIMCKNATVDITKDILSKGKNAILAVNDGEPGNLHKTISGLRTVVDGKHGSLVGIRVKSVLCSNEPATGCNIKPHAPTSDCLDCLITIYS